MSWILQNVLILLAAFGTVPIALSKSTGPEGPVGAHMVTLPLALLQAVALGIAIGSGAFDAIPGGRLTAGVLVAGYVITMVVLPIAAIGSRERTGGMKLATLAFLAACLVVVNASGVVQLVGGAVIGIGGLVGFGMVGALWIASVNNRAKVARQHEESMTEFEKNQAAFHLAEYQKLPEDAALWQLIQLVHAFEPNVKRLARERIAALPDLENEMIALLGTGWAEHSIDYIADGYPLRHGPLGPAFATFLAERLEHWESTLLNDQHAGKWDQNLRKFFTVAELIQADGGDLRPQLTAWVRLLKRVKGLQSLQSRVREVLEAKR